MQIKKADPAAVSKDRRPRPRRRLACRWLREGGARDRPPARRPELPRRLVVARQAQCQLCRPHAARRRSRAGVAVRRHHRGPGRMVGGARHRLLGGRLARRHDRRRFRRPARFLRARRRDPCDPALRRVRSTTRANSCRRRAPPPGSSRSWWSSPAAMRKARRRRRPTPARSPVRMRSTTRRSGAPACCGCSTSTNCSPRPRRSGGCGRSSGKRLAILTNGGGIGVLAVDRLVDLGGTLAGISPATMPKLDSALPPIWSRANPVDIAGDADPARYAAALEGLIADPENDAILVMNVPTALASAPAAAQIGRRRRAGAPQQRDPAEADLRRLGRHQRRRHADLRSRRHSELRDRIRRGPRLYASGALPRGAGRPDGDAAEPAAGLQAGRRRRARRRRRVRCSADAPGSIRSR